MELQFLRFGKMICSIQKIKRSVINSMINLFKRKILIGFIVFCIVFFASLFTISDYSANWDEAAVHFARGQAILNYLVTGKKDFSNLQNSVIKKSYYQSESLTYNFFEKGFEKGGVSIGIGHPPLSNIFAAVFNTVFYRWFNVLGDVEAYHLYSVFLAALLIAVVFYFVATEYSLFSGIIAALSLEFYPLFLGESRYNTKDIPEAVFFSFSVLCLYKAIASNSIRWVFFSSIFTAFAFGTKFNIIFLPLIIMPWIIIYFIAELKKLKFKQFLKLRNKLFFSFLLYPIVGILIFLLAWPNLWADPIERFSYIIDYYKSIGVNSSFDPRFLTFFRFNTYAVQWILFTTPIPVLVLSALGFIVSLCRFLAKKDKISILIVLWFAVPIIRVSVPDANIYGGVRQIMEYIPAMAVLSGIGAGYLVKILSKRFIKNLIALQIIVIVAFVPIILKMISMHPNESVYFNSIIGGLKGAKEKNISGWGVSLGSTYRQGAAWLNSNAEKNAKVAFVFELGGNMPKIDLRPDITLYNQVRSGMKREGEYAIGLTHDGTLENLYYRRYLERFLNPVYELKVDDVPILKIWKNDERHTKPQYLKKEQKVADLSYSEENGNIIVDLKTITEITRIETHYGSTNCTKPTNGYFQISKDGKSWITLPGTFTFFYFAAWFKTQPEEGKLNFLFAADPARFIRLIINDNNSCLLLHKLGITVWYI